MPVCLATAFHPPTRLDPEESYCPNPALPSVQAYLHPTSSPIQTRRHANWQPLRALTAAALAAANFPTLQLDRFRMCGANAWLLRNKNDPATHKFVLNTCKMRLCRPCAAERAALIRANLLEAVKDREIRFLTLTLKSTDEPLRLTVARLHAYFRQLRRKPLFSKRVVGGAAFVEVTRNAQTCLWHVHLHCLIEGKFLPKEALSRDWLAITGDSYIVDIRRPLSTAGIANYVTKYVTKPFNPGDKTNLKDLTMAAQALEHAKLASTFGSWRRLHVLTGPSDRDWTRVDLSTAIVASVNLTPYQRKVALAAWHAFESGEAGPEFTMPPEPSPDTS